jgi:adenosylmethionine-8-amino-7-oxononanoate aminotransferase
MMCVGKGISGAYAPLAAVLMTPRIGAAFWGDADKNLQFQAGHTHAGNPVSAAAGLATIQTMKQRRIPEQVRRTGAYLGAQLAALAQRCEYIGAVRGLGLLHAVEFVQDRATWQPLPSAVPLATAVQRNARARGLLLRASPHIATLAPPLIITEAEIDEMVGILSMAIDDVTREYRDTGRLEMEVAFGL